MLLAKPRAAAVAAGRAALPHSHEHRSVPDYVRRPGKRSVPRPYRHLRVGVVAERPAQLVVFP
jgi:hypothetical protein